MLPSIVLFLTALGSISRPGTISGDAVDNAGGGVAATISLKSHVKRGVLISQRTNKRGSFRLENVRAGDYQLCIAAAGFETECLESFTLEPGKQKRLGQIILRFGKNSCCGGLSVMPPTVPDTETPPLKKLLPLQPLLQQP
jgi:hypothetical protein